MGKTWMLVGAVACLAWASCQKEGSDNPGNMELLSFTLNGVAFEDGVVDVPIQSTITMVFTQQVDPTAFDALVSLRSVQGEEDYTPIYSNNSSKVTLQVELEMNQEYWFECKSGVLGVNGEEFPSTLTRTFTTQEGQIITTLPPCNSSTECMRSVSLTGSLGEGEFTFYSNYPIYENNARWINLTQAIFVVHGASINPEDYYGYLTNTLNALELSDSTILIAPHFKTESQGNPNDYYWSSLNWREGRESRNSNKISSFAAVDQLIERLSDTTYFPFMEKIIVTGQSSGGLFTHLFAPSNRSEMEHPDLEFNYIVSESQYFFYPDERRINENDGELYTPGSCTGYTIWPFGFEVNPQYTNSINEEEFINRFVSRSITYLIGGIKAVDGSLNTTDCSATLLGSTRAQRGENMFQYMELVYPSIHQHHKVVVPGVNHQGSVIYQSEEFRELLKEIVRS